MGRGHPGEGVAPDNIGETVNLEPGMMLQVKECSTQVPTASLAGAPASFVPLPRA